jgi:hypothetical protein
MKYPLTDGRRAFAVLAPSGGQLNPYFAFGVKTTLSLFSLSLRTKSKKLKK